MPILFYIILTTFTISLLSFCGAVFLYKRDKHLSRAIILLVGLSTGTLLGGAFFHLIPESLDTLDINEVSLLVVISFSLFYLIERFLHWHHCHDKECEAHAVGYINLIGDSLHNFIDGLIVAAAFAVDIKFGIVTGIALAVHELPQELGDFGVLIHYGFTKQKALLYNFIVGLMSLVGGVIGYFALSILDTGIPYLLPIAAGGFIYISTSDLIPELKKDEDSTSSFYSFMLFLVGILIMYFLKGFSG